MTLRMHGQSFYDVVHMQYQATLSTNLILASHLPVGLADTPRYLAFPLQKPWLDRLHDAMNSSLVSFLSSSTSLK